MSFLLHVDQHLNLCWYEHSNNIFINIINLNETVLFVWNCVYECVQHLYNMMNQ